MGRQAIFAGLLLWLGCSATSPTKARVYVPAEDLGRLKAATEADIDDAAAPKEPSVYVPRDDIPRGVEVAPVSD